ncbi:MAG TPA: hypothetical protein VJ955_01545, partial [Desulfuromonadales bacterium]|nr:hypothetical protein [Desulfuromonadales bacterium]
ENDDSPSQLLSLYLQLKGLGSLQINLLYDEDGLFLRFLCDSKRVTAFISSFRAELENMLSSVLPLNGVSFTEGAVPPVQALAQKLLQGDRGVINERI